MTIIKKQGVDVFYMYKKPYKYYHHTQIGQIHHALYKYGKKYSKYMIFCDFDEYLYIPKMSIVEFLDKTDIDFLGFKNRWATPVSNMVLSYFPSELMVSTTEYEYSPHSRSKTIYKPDIVKFIGIHAPSLESFNINRPIRFYHNFEMFHMYNLSNPKRVINEPFKRITI